MSSLGDALRAVKEALLLAERVERMGLVLTEIARELREHDRRITRIEAQWDTALRLTSRPHRIPGPRGEG